MSYNKITGMYEGYIYKIYNDVNDKLYIGQTYRTTKCRWKEHCYNYVKYDYALYYAMRKYGIANFSIAELEKIKCLSKHQLMDKLDEREKYWISFYDTYYDGYNETPGGSEGPNKYPEVPVIEYDMDCNEICRYRSIVDAADANGFSRSDVTSCCRRVKVKRVQNRIFRYVESPLTDDEIIYYKSKYPKIYQYDIYGALIGTYEFIYNAVDILAENGINIDNGNIIKCCDGRASSAAGFVWRKHPDLFNTHKTPDVRKIEQRDINTGDIVYIYNNFNEIRVFLNSKNISSVIGCCNRHTACSHGYHWCYEGEFNINELRSARGMMVNQYTLDGIYVATYNNCSDAAKIICPHAKSGCGAIAAACNKTSGRKSAYGYMWKYVIDCS